MADPHPGIANYAGPEALTLYILRGAMYERRERDGRNISTAKKRRDITQEWRWNTMALIMERRREPYSMTVSRTITQAVGPWGNSVVHLFGLLEKTLIRILHLFINA